MNEHRDEYEKHSHEHNTRVCFRLYRQLELLEDKAPMLQAVYLQVIVELAH